MSRITDRIQEIVDTPKPTKCQVCIALLAVDDADRKALDLAYESGSLNAKQVAEILAEQGVFTGSTRHSPQVHYREGHLK